MKWLAPAKINLSLRVLGRRADGFHEIETLMVPLDLADEITLATVADAGADGIELICSDPTLPTGAGNLAFRAAALFKQRLGGAMPPVKIGLTKQVPHGAGLGGGSSDAATVLLALNETLGAGLATEELAALAAELGSDVPFFIYRRAAFCRGRGETIEPTDFAPTLPIILFKPEFPIPTPWAYQRWRDSRELAGVLYGAQRFPWGDLVNDLERPVFEKYVMLADLKMWLLGQPEVTGALLSGSGSTVLALLRDGVPDPSDLARRARESFGELWSCRCASRLQLPSVHAAAI